MTNEYRPAGQEDGGVMSTADRLIYMANQIARNFQHKGNAAAAVMVADHLRSFWDPAMRARIVALARERPGDLSEIAADAIARISVP